MQKTYPTQATTQKQTDANRVNALLSSGPRSAAGKARVALNALRHGLTGQVTLMTPEDRVAFESHLADYLNILKPADAFERDLAITVAEDAWRLKTVRAIEQNIFAVGHTRNVQVANTTYEEAQPPNAQVEAAFSSARTFLDESKQLQLLTLYEQRIQRSMHKQLADLRALQSQRTEARTAALTRAKLYAQMSYAEGKPWDPANDPSPELSGFAFTCAEINAQIREERRWEKAVHHSTTGWDLSDGYGSEDLPVIDLPEDAKEVARPAGA